MGIQQDAPGNLDLPAKLFLWYGLDGPYAQVREDHRSWSLVESLKNLSTLGKKSMWTDWATREIARYLRPDPSPRNGVLVGIMRILVHYQFEGCKYPVTVLPAHVTNS